MSGHFASRGDPSKPGVCRWGDGAFCSLSCGHAFGLYFARLGNRLTVKIPASS